ncbi:MAG: hypothetical protein OXP69_07735 [Spirochaetaceae bacterium]|nr:hypothetical protein [Spirochaetaceae bacterium]
MEEMPAIGTSIMENPVRMSPEEAEEHRKDDAAFRKSQQELNNRYQELIKHYPDQWIGVHQAWGSCTAIPAPGYVNSYRNATSQGLRQQFRSWRAIRGF